MATEIWVNSGSGNGLLPDGTKPLPECWLINTKVLWQSSHGTIMRRSEDKYKLEQLERLRSEDTPHRLKFLNFEMGITRDTPSEVAW